MLNKCKQNIYSKENLRISIENIGIYNDLQK